MDDLYQIEDDSSSAEPSEAPDEVPPGDFDEQMSRSSESIAPPAPRHPSDDRAASARALQDALAVKHVCPFCGSQNAAPANGATAGPCPRCTMEDTAATRQATKARIGPWHVLQSRNPAAPGMRYATLLALVGKGQVTARSIVRGPTTHQLWRWAAHVRGLSREFGLCYSCGQSIEKSTSHCPLCDRSQEPQGNPDALLEIRDPARDARPPAPGSPTLTIAGDDSGTIDPYAVTRASHAERLRNQNESRGDYRPVETRIESAALATAGAAAGGAAVGSSALGGAALGRRRADGRILSSMELAAALQVAPATAPAEEHHPIRTTVLTLLVVGVLGSIVIAYARPDLRHQASDWLNANWQPMQSKVNSWSLQPKPSGQANPQNVATNDTPAPTDLTPPAASNTPDVNTPSASDRTMLPPAVTQAQPTPAPAPVAPAVTPQPAPQATTPPPAAQPQPAPADTNIAVTDQQDHPALSREPAVVKNNVPVNAGGIRGLRDQALTAESNKNWATVVALYEKIEEYPKDQWPSDTQARLSYARHQLAGSNHHLLLIFADRRATVAVACGFARTARSVLTKMSTPAWFNS